MGHLVGRDDSVDWRARHVALGRCGCVLRGHGRGCRALAGARVGGAACSADHREALTRGLRAAWVGGTTQCALLASLAMLSVAWPPRLVSAMPLPTREVTSRLRPAPPRCAASHNASVPRLLAARPAGLVLPPRIAPYQVVIVPFAAKDPNDALAVDTAVSQLKGALLAKGVRVHIDSRDHVRAGAK